jgi:hypothetical protein
MNSHWVIILKNDFRSFWWRRGFVVGIMSLGITTILYLLLR